MPKILLLIPAYNEAGNIEKVVEELTKSYQGYDYLVINDGSRDHTAQICLREGYHYMSMPVNVGLAGVFGTGMKYADAHGYDMVLQYDGDGQHDPKYIASMIKQMLKNNADIVIGSRYLKETGKFTPRMAGSFFLRQMIFMTTGKKIMDPTSGMRLYGKRMIHLLGSHINMPPEPDTLAYLIKCGCRIEEVDVRMRERTYGESYLNFGNSMRYMANMLVSILLIHWFREKEVL